MQLLRISARVVSTAVAITLLSFCSLAQAQQSVSLVIGSGGTLEVPQGTGGTIPVLLDSSGHDPGFALVVNGGTLAVEADLLDQGDLSFDNTGSTFTTATPNPAATQDLSVAFFGTAFVNGPDGLELVGTLEFDTSNLEVGDTFTLTFSGSEFPTFTLENILLPPTSVQVTVVATSILGDTNMDGMVNFLDIGPFVSLLSEGGFLDQADIDRNGVVNFLDIGPFIGILSEQ